MDFDLVLQVRDVFGRAGAHVVEDCDAVSAGYKGIGKVRTDESGTTGDESAHEVESIFRGLNLLQWQQQVGLLALI